jgi:hypothetical protein
MITRSAVASAHLARLTVAGHRATCSPSPALPRTGSPVRWSASQRHILPSVCVRPLQPSPLGTARTPSPWASRPVGDPMFRSGGTCSRDVGAPLMPFNALAAHRPSAKAWHGRNSIPYIPMASGIQTCYRRVCGSTTGHWGLGNPALTLSRRRCRTMPYTSSDISCFPTMLLFPRPFGSRLGGRLGVICLELRPPLVAIRSVRDTAHSFPSSSSSLSKAV